MLLATYFSIKIKWEQKNKINLPNNFTDIKVVDQTSGDKLTGNLKILYKVWLQFNESSLNGELYKIYLAILVWTSQSIIVSKFLCSRIRYRVRCNGCRGIMEIMFYPKGYTDIK